MVMKAKSPYDLYNLFLSALSNAIKDGGHGTASYIAKNTGVSASLISQAINPDSPKKIGEENQVKIAEFLSGSYENFLSMEEPLPIKQDLIEQKEGTTPTEHRSIKKTDTDEFKVESKPMDQDIKKILQDHIEVLKQNEERLCADLERERQEHKDAMEHLREDLKRGRVDLERERQEYKDTMERERRGHERAMAELREDYRELKAEAKELRVENKQLLEQRRALQKTNAQPSQGPEKAGKTTDPQKKAVNQ
jgi:hypothetical protein